MFASGVLLLENITLGHVGRSTRLSPALGTIAARYLEAKNFSINALRR